MKTTSVSHGETSECEFKKECESVSGECMFHRKEDCKLTRKFAILVRNQAIDDIKTKVANDGWLQAFQSFEDFEAFKMEVE